MIVTFLYAIAAPAADLVTTTLPGFENVTVPFKFYSGFLNVTGPVAGYDSFVIHYQFHESQRSPSKDPFMIWRTCTHALCDRARELPT